MAKKIEKKATAKKGSKKESSRLSVNRKHTSIMGAMHDLATDKKQMTLEAFDNYMTTQFPHSSFFKSGKGKIAYRQYLGFRKEEKTYIEPKGKKKAQKAEKKPAKKNASPKVTETRID